MNFFFPTASTPSSPSSAPSKTGTPSQDVQARALPPSSSTTSSPATSFSPLTPASNSIATGGSSANLPDIDLSIEVDPSFHGILLGVPEESPGAIIYVTIVLHVRRKPIRASKLQATFDGRIKVQCSDGATFGHDHHRERVLAHRDWTLWEASSNSSIPTGESKNHIPIGTHYYPLSIQLDGALPPSFSGKHGSVRYFLSAVLMRPLFHSDIHTLFELPIGRCLVPDEGSGPQSSLEEGVAAGLSLLPGMGSTTTITHHNTHKELLRYTASSPPIAFLDRELIQLDLALEPLPPGSRIHSISYGLKEIIRYQSSTSGNVVDNKCEIVYPLGQQTVIIPRDPERESAMSSAGAGASTRQLLELRTDPDLVNVDMVTSLIDIQHRLTCNVAVVLEDPGKRASSNTDNNALASGGHRRERSSYDSQSSEARDGQGQGTIGASRVFSGGGILRRLNLAPQPLAPTLDLVDSTGSTVENHAVLLGEPTRSIIAPAPAPATIELNDAPPPPPANLTESTVLEFPIILTSRHPRGAQGMQPQATPPSFENNQRRPSQHQHLVQPPQQQQPSIPTVIQTSHQQHVLRIPRHQGSAGGGTVMYSPGPDGADGQGYYQPLATVSPSSVPQSILSISQPMQMSIPESCPLSTAGVVTPTEPCPLNSLHNNVNGNTSGEAEISALQHPLDHSRRPMRSGISAGLQAAAAAAAAMAPTAAPVASSPSTANGTPVMGEEGEEPPTYEDVVHHDLQIATAGLSLQASLVGSVSSPREAIDMVGARSRQPSQTVASFSSQQASSPLLIQSTSFQNPVSSFGPSSIASSSSVLSSSQHYRQYSPPPPQRSMFLASSLPPSSQPRVLSTSPTMAVTNSNMGFRAGHARSESTASNNFMVHPPTAQPLQQQQPSPLAPSQHHGSLYRHASLGHVAHGIPTQSNGGGPLMRSSTSARGSTHGRHRRQTSTSGGGSTTSSIMIESLSSHGGYLSQAANRPSLPVSQSLPVAAQFAHLDPTPVSAATHSGDSAGADGSPPRYRSTSFVPPSPM